MASITFTQDVELDIVVDLDEDNPVEEIESFSKGSTEYVEILSETENSISVQFEDGSCCYGISKDCLEISF